MLLNADHLMRQLDLIPLDVLNKPVTIIGAGAIGSFTTLALAKMGFTNLTVWDFDEVSVENMNCQWYRHKDIGKKKVEALQSLIKDFTEEEIRIVPERYESGSFPGLVVTAVDSMLVRRTLWDNHLKSFQTEYIIDPRMSLEYAALYVMNPNSLKDIESYEKCLYTDEGSVQEKCTAKATMYTASMIAGLVAKAVKDIATGKPYPRVTQWDISKNNLLSYESKH